MITLDLNTDGKRIKFAYAVANVDPKDITGKFVMDFGDSNVSFPIRTSNNNIIVELRTDNLFIRNSFGKIIKARLEIVASRDTFIIPWTGEIEVIKSKKKEIKKPDKPKTVKKKVKEEIEDEKDDSLSLLEQKINKIKSLTSKKDASEIKEIRTKIGKKLTDEEDYVFKDFLNTPIEEILFTKEQIEERKKEREMIDRILNISIDELME